MTKHAPAVRTLAAALAVSAVAGCGAGTSPDTATAAPQGNTSRLTTSQSTASQSAAPQNAAAQAEVTKQLTRLERTRHARIGAFAIDTGTGRTVSHRADETFPFASTFKAMACGAVLRKARQSAPGLLDKVIRYTEADLVDYSPVTEKHVGTGMTVADLCHAAITQSDNTAGNLVLRQIGGPAGLTAFLRSLGDRVSRSDRWETALNDWRPGERRDTTAPRPWADDLRALTTGNALVPADRGRLVGWLKATVTGDKRIRAGLPKSWTVGDKTGTGGTYGTANDIAIAYPKAGAPLIIVITTNKRTPDAEADDKAIARTAGILARALRPAG
ncbi:class A beta-lactamase [Actinomadura bangladeshensis]|uniref:Beta-lactamase n=1 Tax=Actinomadura bangladeshensis TaxID=453573 RepID=A0A4R4P0N3_9ACTN|nr:class A beta-lactamase [Actinomadura bangladeshensis]TDC15778.1 class A beta-lactamase [Actinomadura bangladeshensis]